MYSPSTRTGWALCGWASLLVLMVTCATGLHPAQDHCQTLTAELSVTREKTYEHNGRRLRLQCLGTIEVNKCEGACQSQVSPSVVQFPRFKKECKCCRESTLRDHLVTLDRCYDGSMLVPGQFTAIVIKEPTDCRCSECAGV